MARVTIHTYQCDKCNRTSAENPNLGFVEAKVSSLRVVGRGSPRALYRKPNSVHLCDECSKTTAFGVELFDAKDVKTAPRRGNRKPNRSDKSDKPRARQARVPKKPAKLEVQKPEAIQASQGSPGGMNYSADEINKVRQNLLS